MRKNGTLTYLHSDHLGSTVLETNTAGNQTADQKYFAYGSQRDAAPVTTDHKFTGQKSDATGLVYMNARYYDPVLGAFISPDTIVPDGTNLFDYNRYMYVRGRVFNANDPSGHCVNSTTTSKPDEITYDNDECWRLANTIGAMWDNTNYWSSRFTSKDVFFNYVANNGYNGTDFFQGQLDFYHRSEEFAAWKAQHPPKPVPQNVLDDPQCGGGRLCQAMAHSLDQVDAYCTQNDCVAIGVDMVGVAGTATVLVACIPGAAVCAGTTAVYIGATLATGSTIYGTGRTVLAWNNGTATNQDLTVSLITAGGSLISGGVAPDMYDIQVGYSLGQLIWDTTPKSED